MTRRSPLPHPRFSVPGGGPDLASTTGRARVVDVTVTEWAADLTGPVSGARADTTTTGGANGFVDFDVIDSVHTGWPRPITAVGR